MAETEGTGRESLTWSSSVDFALCFGWIDGIRKAIDKQSYKIRFTPRDYICWVMSAKKEETRLKRLGILIASSEEGLKCQSCERHDNHLQCT